MGTPEVLQRGRAYPGHGHPPKFYMWTGEKRPPKAGEYFLSGAIITAYKAHADMGHWYHIAVEVPRPVCPTCGRPRV